MSRATAAISASHIVIKTEMRSKTKVSHVGSVMSCYIVTCRVKPLRKSKKETVNWTNWTFQSSWTTHLSVLLASAAGLFQLGLRGQEFWLWIQLGFCVRFARYLMRCKPHDSYDFRLGIRESAVEVTLLNDAISLNASDSPKIISSSSVLHGRNLVTKWGMDRDCDFMPWVKDNAFFSQFGNTSWKMVQPF